MKTVPLILAGAAIALNASAADIVVSQKNPIDTVTFSASGKSDQMAGKAKVRLCVETESPSLREGISKNKVAQKNLIGYLVAAGIPKTDIKTDKFSSIPRHGLLKNRVRSYTITTTVEATISTERQFLALAQRVDESNDVRLAGHEVDYDNREEVSRNASLEAYENLEKKRVAFEQRLKVKLELVSLSESNGRVNAGNGDRVFGAPVVTGGGRSGNMAPQSQATDYLVGEIQPEFGKISASMTLTASYRIIRPEAGREGVASRQAGP